MGRYRKIDTRIWNDANFRALSDDGKLVFIFVLTHPHLTSLGAMRATASGLAKELGWPVRRFAKGFGEPLRKGLIEYDDSNCFLALPNFLRYNGPENPNVVTSYKASFELLPECDAKLLLYERLKGFIEPFGGKFIEAFKGLPKPLAKGMPNPEPEQEPLPEQDSPFKSPRGEFSKHFAVWWETYPRKVEKEAANKAWVKAGKRLVAGGLERTAAVAKLQDACIAFAASETAKSEFCPYPATWLNKGRYDDDPSAWKQREFSNGNPDPAHEYLGPEQPNAPRRHG